MCLFITADNSALFYQLMNCLIGYSAVRDYAVVLNIDGACATAPRYAASQTRILVGHHKTG